MRKHRLTRGLEQEFFDFLGLEPDYCLYLKDVCLLKITEEQYSELLETAKKQETLAIEKLSVIASRYNPIYLSDKDIIIFFHLLLWHNAKIEFTQTIFHYICEDIEEHSVIASKVVSALIECSKHKPKLKKDVIKYWKDIRRIK
jgi:hypothetical protein